MVLLRESINFAKRLFVIMSVFVEISPPFQGEMAMSLVFPKVPAARGGLLPPSRHRLSLSFERQRGSHVCSVYSVAVENYVAIFGHGGVSLSVELQRRSPVRGVNLWRLVSLSVELQRYSPMCRVYPLTVKNHIAVDYGRGDTVAEL